MSLSLAVTVFLLVRTSTRISRFTCFEVQEGEKGTGDRGLVGQVLLSPRKVREGPPAAVPKGCLRPPCAVCYARWVSEPLHPQARWPWEYGHTGPGVTAGPCAACQPAFIDVAGRRGLLACSLLTTKPPPQARGGGLSAGG